MKEIDEVCQRMEYSTQALDLDETEIPTILISIAKNANDEDIFISCNLIPLQIYGVSALFLQLYMCVSNEIPENKIDEVEEFIKMQNERFMIGNALEFANSVCVKYSLYLDPNEPIDKDLLERSIDIFVYQANVIAQKVADLVDGKVTLEYLAEQGTFS